MSSIDDISILQLFESCANGTPVPVSGNVDEGAGKNALVGLAALTALCLPASARSSSSSAARNRSSIVQTYKTYGGYTKEQAINIVARTIYKEAEGEPAGGMKLVATVIWNRAKGVAENLPGVCKAASQFSCWGGMTPEEWNPSTFRTKERTGSLWDEAKRLAKSMVNGGFVKSGDYTHYYANRGAYAVKNTPDWAKGIAGHQSGNHIFFTQAEIDQGRRRMASAGKNRKATTKVKS